MDVGPIWYSYDVTKSASKRRWTHQVTQRELPSSTDIAGVNMRLTAAAFANCIGIQPMSGHHALWKCRVTVLNPDGTIFIDDVSKGDLCISQRAILIPSRPVPDGCEFLLVFDQACFRKTIHSYLGMGAHTLLTCCRRTLDCQRALSPIYRLVRFTSFPQTCQSLAEDRAAVGEESAVYHRVHLQNGSDGADQANYWGEIRVVDSHNFPVAKNVASA